MTLVALSDATGEPRQHQGAAVMSEKCRLGYVEYDGYRYCFAHGQFVHEYGPHPLRCDGATVAR